MNVNKKTVKRGLLPYLFLLLIMLGVFYFFNVFNQKVNVLNYNEFIDVVNDGDIEEVILVPRDRAKTYEVHGKLKGYKENETFFARLPMSEQVMKRIVEASETQSFKFKTEADPEACFCPPEKFAERSST